MSHDNHPSLPGYDPRQIWVDGCAECERRGKSVPDSLGNLDFENLRRAWERAESWDSDTLAPDDLVSGAELPLLRYFSRLKVTIQMLNMAGIFDVVAL